MNVEQATERVSLQRALHKNYVGAVSDRDFELPTFRGRAKCASSASETLPTDHVFSKLILPVVVTIDHVVYQTVVDRSQVTGHRRRINGAAAKSRLNSFDAFLSPAVDIPVVDTLGLTDVHAAQLFQASVEAAAEAGKRIFVIR